jgi:hypothetical protein
MAMHAGTLKRLLVTLAVCVSLNAALTMQNAWPSLWVEPGSGVSIELLALLGALAICMARRPQWGNAFVWFLSVLLFLLIMGRYCAVTAHALFGRSINLYFDLPHLPAVISMTAEARPVGEVALFAVLIVAVPLGLLLAVRFGIGAVARSLSDRVVRRAAMTVAFAGILAYAATGLLGRRRRLCRNCPPPATCSCSSSNPTARSLTACRRSRMRSVRASYKRRNG